MVMISSAAGSGAFGTLRNGTSATGTVINQSTSNNQYTVCLLYTSPSPRDRQKSRMPSSA